LNKLEEHNLLEIESLSQRGQTLSIVHLIEANTLSIEMAAHLLYFVSNRVSFLTAAMPGNAGKTTLMACLLMFLPPNTKIITISEPDMLLNPPEAKNDERIYYLCHEIGSGHWYGYLWGNDVARLFSLIDQNKHFLASCIHADTLNQLREILLSKKLNVAEEDFRKIELILFMHLDRSGWKYIRRVSSIYESTDMLLEQPSHRPIFLWDENTDKFHKQNDSLLLKKLAKKNEKTEAQIYEKIAEYEDFFEWLLSKKIYDYRKVRQEILRLYAG